MASLQIEGVIEFISEERVFGRKKQFKAKEIWIKEDAENYPQTYSISFPEKLFTVIDQYIEGEMVIVDVNLRGTSYINKDGERKVFTSLTGWRIKSKALPNTNTRKVTNEESDEDLPF